MNNSLTIPNMIQIDGEMNVITSVKKKTTLSNWKAAISQILSIFTRFTDDRETNTPIW